MESIITKLKSIGLKFIAFCKKYKKRIITVIISGVLAIVIVSGISYGVVYSLAKSNSKYSQSQLEEVALGKISGTVVDTEKELNFRNQSFVYEFKIKDKNNMLQEVKVDSKYGTIMDYGNERHEGNGRNHREGRCGRKGRFNKEGRFNKTQQQDNNQNNDNSQENDEN